MILRWRILCTVHIFTACTSLISSIGINQIQASNINISQIPLLTHWGRVTYISIIVSGNGMSPVRHQAITGTYAGLLSIEHLAANFSENSIAILTFSLKKVRLNMPSATSRPSSVGLNVLIASVMSYHFLLPPHLPLLSQCGILDALYLLTRPHGQQQLAPLVALYLLTHLHGQQQLAPLVVVYLLTYLHGQQPLAPRVAVYLLSHLHEQQLLVLLVLHFVLAPWFRNIFPRWSTRIYHTGH